MARLARIAVSGVAHPVTKRGVNKQDALFVADDKRVYLEHAFNAPRYAGSNQMRLGMVRRSWRYPWSSAAAHCGKAASNPLLDLPARRETMPPEGWIETLGAFEEDANATDAIRRGTRTGRPLGSDSSLSKLETALNRRLRPLPIGRQRGWRKAKPVKQGKVKAQRAGKGGAK